MSLYRKRQSCFDENMKILTLSVWIQAYIWDQHTRSLCVCPLFIQAEYHWRKWEWELIQGRTMADVSWAANGEKGQTYSLLWTSAACNLVNTQRMLTCFYTSVFLIRVLRDSKKESLREASSVLSSSAPFFYWKHWSTLEQGCEVPAVSG